MSSFAHAFYAELLKIKGVKMRWITFIAFAIAPIMGAIFILILGNPAAVSHSSGLVSKAQAMHFEANWGSYFSILIQAVGVGGVMIFGFVASWIFGREYSDGTAKDLLALSISRTTILLAKFVVYFFWCLGLALSNLLLGICIGSLLSLPAPHLYKIGYLLIQYLNTTLLTICLGTPIAIFALWGKGYLAPLGFVALTLVFSQIIAATGFGTYFPWAVPGIYSGSGGDYKESLGTLSYILVILTGVFGLFLTLLYWQKVDHSK